MIVLDASFIVKLVIEEDSSSKARKLLGKWAESGIRLATLDIAFVEAANAICKHVVKVGDLNESDALNALKDIQKLAALIEQRQSTSYLVDALSIALKKRLAVYDSPYLAMALVEESALVTFDSIQGNIARELGIRVYP